MVHNIFTLSHKCEGKKRIGTIQRVTRTHSWFYKASFQFRWWAQDYFLVCIKATTVCIAWNGNVRFKRYATKPNFCYRLALKLRLLKIKRVKSETTVRAECTILKFSLKKNGNFTAMLSFSNVCHCTLYHNTVTTQAW